MAANHPEIEFYIYTKMYNVVIPELKADRVPHNMTVLISIWHEFGIEEYKLVNDCGNVKCFVYDDGYDYKSHGIECGTHCKAYDESGHLDKNITCDKCKKCFNRNDNHRMIGCKAH